MRVSIICNSYKHKPNAQQSTIGHQNTIQPHRSIHISKQIEISTSMVNLQNCAKPSYDFANTSKSEFTKT